MGRKSINDFYTVFHALSHEISGESSILQEDVQTSVYHLAWGRPDVETPLKHPVVTPSPGGVQTL